MYLRYVVWKGKKDVGDQLIKSIRRLEWESGDLPPSIRQFLVDLMFKHRPSDSFDVDRDLLVLE
eukprot:14337661-Ditylum_brightwellii.AAC.1